MKAYLDDIYRFVRLGKKPSVQLYAVLTLRVGS
jgi:hypothetical protein